MALGPGSSRCTGHVGLAWSLACRQLRRTHHHARAHLSRPPSRCRDRSASSTLRIRRFTANRFAPAPREEDVLVAKRRVPPYRMGFHPPRDDALTAFASKNHHTFIRPRACPPRQRRSRRWGGLRSDPCGPRRGVRLDRRLLPRTSFSSSTLLVLERVIPRGRLAFHDEGAASARPHPHSASAEASPFPGRPPRSTSRGYSPRAPRVTGPLWFRREDRARSRERA